MGVEPEGNPIKIPLTISSVSPAEPGYTTTEFWLTVVTSFIGLLTTFNVVHFTNPQMQALLGFAGLVIPVIVYTISRGIRKKV